MRYDKAHTRTISFPLGGIGSGCIGLAGNGSMVDWEIFNHPDKHSRNGITHFAVRAEKAGKVIDFRVLNGDLPTPYDGSDTPASKLHSGFGYGPAEATMASFPHFREHTFYGTWPVAKIDFSGERFPANPSLEAWSVFIPGESRSASLPAAFFEIELENTAREELDYTVIGVLANPWGTKNTTRYNRWEGNQLTCYSGDGTGELTLSLNAPPSEISGQTCFYRGAWRDHLEYYRNDVFRGGRFINRTYDSPPEKPGFEPGLLAAHFRLAPGEKRRTCFIITWHVPIGEITWRNSNWDEELTQLGLKRQWKNYYATQWRDSRDSGAFAMGNYAALREGTFRYRDALFTGNLPENILDGASANASVLKSPTCIRVEDGTFWGWEGVSSSVGSCEGSCTHVWNYAQTMPFLFPDIEQSMRESHLKYSIDENGGSHFRVMMPLGIHATAKFHRPCADGQFGDVMKIYRDWKISGDDEFVRRWYPEVKRTIEYAWSSQNPDRWDPEQTGVLHGRQHHTLDMELFGPNVWLTGHYLGALKAGAELAGFAGDKPFADQCRKLFAKGYEYVRKNLFNGEYFIQKIDLSDHALLESFDAVSYWDNEGKEIKYQIDDGCAIDAPLAQFYATLYGLGELFDQEQLHACLKSIYHYNFKHSMRDEVNTWRVYSLNDEAGVQICTWPHERRPKIPLTYNSETMTGFEWAYAGGLAAEGMVKEAEEVASAIRFRFDGDRRNPWNEFECGSNYARSMAAFGLLPALAGFRYDRSAGMLGFAPKYPEFSGFWALGTLWGNYTVHGDAAELELKHGKFTIKELRLDRPVKQLELDGKAVELPLDLNAGEKLIIRF